jgi:hypothetical protein
MNKRVSTLPVRSVSALLMKSAFLLTDYPGPAHFQWGLP